MRRDKKTPAVAATKKKPKPRCTDEREAKHGMWVSRLVRWGELLRSIDRVMEQVNQAANDGLIEEEAAQAAIGQLNDAASELYSGGIPE